MKNLVIIPTYNEKDNIEAIINVTLPLHPKFEILVVDDNSPDGTAQIVKNLMSKYQDRLHILERKKKEGLGPAYIAGFKWAIERKYDLISEMDADFSHPPEKLLDMHKVCAEEGYDMAIGSRYITGVNVVDWPIGRVIMSYYASAYVRFITGMNIKDTTAGFVTYRRSVLETIGLDNIKMKGYGFQIEMKFKAWKYGFKIKEVPIIFIDRKNGASKMTGGIFNEAFWGVIGMKIRSWFEKYEKVK